MKIFRCFFTLLLIIFFHQAQSQKAADLFNKSDVKVTWLGLDFSHVRLVGDFNEFSEAGNRSTVQIRGKYFPSWNQLILNEPNKYDIKGMLRKGNMVIDIDMIANLNAKTPLEEMETYNPPDYSGDDIKKFVQSYPLEGKTGIGVVFLVECLNKPAKNAVIHFIALDMSSKDILIHEEMNGKPNGIGLRNYWGGAVYDVIKRIKSSEFKRWKEKYKG